MLSTLPDLLCESCGYMLNNLPVSGNCPECGQPISISADPTLRQPPAWETPAGPGADIRNFLATTAQVIFRPAHFYRTLATRASSPRATIFGHVHWFFASCLLALAAQEHVEWYRSIGPVWWTSNLWSFLIICVFTYGFVWGTTRLAALLTTWEANYRGYRLPPDVVLRGLYYHAAHLLPVGLLAAATVVSYVALRSAAILQMTSATAYLYILCGEVVVLATYLFWTYWTGMRNMMYANW